MPVIAVLPIIVLPPRQIILFVPVAATGNGLTVTVTELYFVHPVAVIVSVRVYVVVTVGDTVGFDVVEVNPIGFETHEYVLPDTAVAPIEVLTPIQIALSPPVEASGKGLTLTMALLLFEQPVAVIVSVRV